MKITITLFILIITINGFSQNTLPICGFKYLYDAVGNRIARITVYCTNSSKKENDTIIPSKKLIAEYEIVKLFPNPTSRQFTMEFNMSLVDAEFFLYNNTGQLISSKKASGDKIPFDISSFAAGTYRVVVYHDDKSKAAVLIKE